MGIDGQSNWNKKGKKSEQEWLWIKIEWRDKRLKEGEKMDWSREMECEKE